MVRADGGDAHARALHRARSGSSSGNSTASGCWPTSRATACGCSRAIGCRSTFPALADAIAALPADELILDGELTWRAEGYHVFDILWLDGRSVTSLPLDERRARLAALPLTPPLHLVERIDDPEPWTLACREGWEGVVAKRRDSPYEHRRSPHWLKMKCEESQRASRRRLHRPARRARRSRRVARRFADGDEFVFAGKVGTGLDTAMLLDLRARLDRLEIARSPFTKAIGLPRLRAHWVKPEIVVQVGFIEWTVTASCVIRGCSGSGVTRALRDVVREQVVISHPEKVLFPDDGITKGELAAYYEAIAPVMLPHLAGRPVTMERFHRGIGEKGFFQKDVVEGLSRLARARRGAEEGRHGAPSARHRRARLLWLANQNCITPHVWAVARAGAVSPGRLRVRSRSCGRRSRCAAAAALALRDLLAELDLRAG